MQNTEDAKRRGDGTEDGREGEYMTGRGDERRSKEDQRQKDQRKEKQQKKDESGKKDESITQNAEIQKEGKLQKERGGHIQMIRLNLLRPPVFRDFISFLHDHPQKEF